ncbi:hypothetical protein M1512_00830 [Patescibacteria group bacterium]|nr:hypothetical protein [Patescibacteria group bacterium]
MLVTDAAGSRLNVAFLKPVTMCFSCQASSLAVNAALVVLVSVKAIARSSIVGLGLVSPEEANRYAFNRDLVSQVDFLDKEQLSSFLIGFSAVDPIVFVEGNPLVPAGTESGFGCQYQPTGTVFYMRDKRDVKSSTMDHSSTLLIET